MKVRYLIKRRNKKAKDYHIYVALYDGDTTEIISTGQRTSLKEWDRTHGIPKDHRSDVSSAIEKVKADVQKAIKRLEVDEEPVTPFTIKDKYAATKSTKSQTQAQADRKAKADLVTIVKLADRWLQEELFRFRKSTQKSVTESINAFTSYLKTAGLASLERRELNKEIITKYERYLLEKRKLSDNTHGKRMKQLRWFLKSLDYDVSSIKLRSSKKTIVSLTLAELRKLEAVDVSERVEWQKAKDMFLLGCYTGLRVSDLRRLNHTNTRDNFITLKLLKNNRDVKIPIVADAQRILDKYGSRAPKISEPAINEGIKEVCEKAVINQPIEVDITRGGQRITMMKPKHELITSHIAGKTFITLAPQRWGLTPAEIAGIVGKDLKTLINSYFNDQSDEARLKIIQMDTVKMQAG
jgi:integrase